MEEGKEAQQADRPEASEAELHVLYVWIYMVSDLKREWRQKQEQLSTW